MKKKEHRFTLVVKTSDSREGAKTAVLCAFASRQPDGCEFNLIETEGVKEAWMAGAKAGTQIAFELVKRSIEKLSETATEAAKIARPTKRKKGSSQ